MGRTFEKKPKPKSKPVKSVKSKIRKESPRLNDTEELSTSPTELDYTLPEGKHLDSFDIFRSNEHR